jgi:hypothetical protein
MEFNVLFDVAVSVLAVVLMFSLAASAINEIIADNLTNLRGRMLAKAVGKLLETKPAMAGRSAEDCARAFFAHPDLKPLMNRGRLPSAIEPRRYAVTALKLFGEREALETETRRSIEALRDQALALVGPAAGGPTEAEIRRAIERIAGGSASLLDKLDLRVDALEREFNEAMDRVSGWYLRRTKITLFLIGLILAVGANVDILRYADRMVAEAAARERAATFAQILGEEAARARIGALLDRPESADGSADRGAEAEAPPIERALADELGALAEGLTELGVPFGWECRDLPAGAAPFELIGCGDGDGLALPTAPTVIGWLIIGMSVTLGAQFWFDLFQRLVRLRTAGLTGGAAVQAARRPVA